MNSTLSLDTIFAAWIGTIPYCVVAIAAVLLTLRLKSRKTNEQQRIKTFAMLASGRGYPMKAKTRDAFNRIPIEFGGRRFQSVREIWGRCWKGFSVEKTILNTQSVLIDVLVSTMAKSLGYKDADMDKWYRPNSDMDKAIDTDKLRKLEIERATIEVDKLRIEKQLLEMSLSSVQQGNPKVKEANEAYAVVQARLEEINKSDLNGRNGVGS